MGSLNSKAFSRINDKDQIKKLSSKHRRWHPISPAQRPGDRVSHSVTNPDRLTGDQAGSLTVAGLGGGHGNFFKAQITQHIHGHDHVLVGDIGIGSDDDWHAAVIFNHIDKGIA